MKNLSDNEFKNVSAGLGPGPGSAACTTSANSATAAAATAAAVCATGNTVSCAVSVANAATAAVNASVNCSSSTNSNSVTPTNVNAMNDVVSNDGGGGGGKVICTELCRNGAIEHEVWMADIRYSRQNFSEQTMRGYHLWGIPYVKLMRKYPSFAKLAEHPTRWFAEDIAYRMGVLSKPNYKGWVLREVFFRPVCFGIGLFAKARDWQALWRDGVTPSGVPS